MKSWFASAILLGLFTPSLASAQRSPADDLNTLLRDSVDVLNRFEEVSPGMAADIDQWRAPAELKKNAKAALAAILRNVAVEKPALNAVLGKTVSSTDLLDAYVELVEVASELESGSLEGLIFSSGDSSGDLSQLGSKAAVLGAKISVALKSQIAAQELKLASCSQKASPPR